MIFDKSFRPRTPAIKSTAASGTEQNISVAQFVDFISGYKVNGAVTGDATYFTCLRVLSESMGKLPLKIVQKSEENGTEQMREHPAYDVLRTRPNPYVTATSFKTSIELCRHHFGNAYAWIQPYGGGVRLWQLPSVQVQVWWDNAMLLCDTPHIWYIWSAPNGKRYPFSEDEILHFPTWYMPDGVCGLAVKDILKLTLDGAVKAQGMLNRLYDNGMTGKAVLQYTGDLNDDLGEAFTKGIEKYIDGDAGSKSLIPLPLGSSITPLNIKLTDGQYLELRKFTALQVAAAFGVKPDQINDYSKSSYSSSEAQHIDFLVDTLLWLITNNEEEYSYKLLSKKEREQGLTAEYNPGVMLKADTKTQMETIKTGVSGGIYTPNEGRNFLGLKARYEGNELYSANGSIIPLRLAGKQYEKKGEENGDK